MKKLSYATKQRAAGAALEAASTDAGPCARSEAWVSSKAHAARPIPCPGWCPAHRAAAYDAGELKRRFACLAPAEALPRGQRPLQPQLAGLQGVLAVICR